MQSAFAGPFPILYEHKPVSPFGAMCFGGEAAAGATAAAFVHPQQQLVQQALYRSAHALEPETPAAGQEDYLNQLWQAAVPGDYEATEGGEAPPQKPANAKQRKAPGKAKKGSSRRDLDKMAKQEQRMIKNRESAARSRLRRQQHTTELEQENETLQAENAELKERVVQLERKVSGLEWSLQLCRMPGNVPHASISVSHQAQAGPAISQLPPAPSLSLSLPHASSLLLPAGPLGCLGPLVTQPTLEVDGGVQQDALGMQMDGFDFAYTSRRGSSYV